MKLIKQLFWFFLFLMVGEIFAVLISPLMVIPGSIFGMILLFVSIHNHWLTLDKVNQVGQWLTDNMTIMFIPLGVGLMTQFPLLGNGVWWKLLLIISISTALMIVLLAIIIQVVLRSKRQEQGSEYEE